jgi:hypothetical protein
MQSCSIRIAADVPATMAETELWAAGVIPRTVVITPIVDTIPAMRIVAMPVMRTAETAAMGATPVDMEAIPAAMAGAADAVAVVAAEVRF